MKNKGLIVIISGPSGVGKGTMVELSREDFSRRGKPLLLSVSSTSRAQASSEIDGVHYNFISKEQFEQGIKEEMFAEYNVYGDCYYGTPAQSLTKALSEGETIIVEIDLNGMRQIKAKYPEAVTVFVLPPSIKTLEERIRQRGRDSDTEEKIQYRLKRAAEEINCAAEYEYLIVNDDLTCATSLLTSIICAEQAKSERNPELIREVYDK